MTTRNDLRRHPHAARQGQEGRQPARGQAGRPARGRAACKLQRRHGFDTAELDDVVMGCVSPVGEQGSVIAKTAALKAGWDFRVAGMQINRFCASGLEAVNLAAQKVASGWEDLVVAGGVESMSRVPIGSDGGAWAQDPQTNLATGFVPQGIGADLIATLDGFTREDVDRLCADVAAARRRGAGRRAFRPLGGAGRRRARPADPRARRVHQAAHDARGPGVAEARVRRARRDGLRCGRDRSAIRRSSASSTCTPRATRRASSTAPRRCWSAARRRAAS